MIEKISSRFHAWAKGWLILVLFVLDGFIAGFVLPMAEALMKGDSGGAGPIDLQFFSTPEKIYGMVESYGEYGRAFYRNIELTVDIIYPIVYTLFFGLLISWLFQRGFSPDSKMQKWNAMPVGAWLFDLLENIGIVTMLSVWPSQPVVIAWLTTLFTMVKWLFAGASILLVLVGLVVAVKNGFKKST